MLGWIYLRTPPDTLEITKDRGLLAQESRENPQGKARFPWELFPGFPRVLCIRAGGFQPPGQKHEDMKPDVLNISLRQQE